MSDLEVWGLSSFDIVKETTDRSYLRLQKLINVDLWNQLLDIDTHMYSRSDYTITGESTLFTNFRKSHDVWVPEVLPRQGFNRTILRVRLSHSLGGTMILD